MRGIVIGAGIGGLSTAIGLQMRDIDIKLYEAASNLSPVGAGILVPPNAMTILGRYKLSEHLQDRGHIIETLVVVDTKGDRISKTPADYVNNNGAYRTVAIHRGQLQKILLEALDPSVVITGYTCLKAKGSLQEAEAVFEDGSILSGEFLIGADGIDSKVRKSIFPNSSLRYSGQTCWRGIASVNLAPKWKAQLTEVWGNGLRFGFVQIAPGQVYWYATKRTDRSQKNIGDGNKKERLLKLYSQFFNPVQEVLGQTEATSIIQNDICDLKPLKKWFSNSILLIGDAAHASTPNLGQGGAQAIEDSWVLAEKIANSHSIQQAFEQFQALRFAKVNKIVNVSWQIGKATNISNGIACTIRNALFRSIPPSLAEKQSRLIYDVSY